MSLTQASFGRVGAKVCSNRFGATEKQWFEFVVALNLRFLLAAQGKLAPQSNDAITAGVESLGDEFRLQAQGAVCFASLHMGRLDGGGCK